VLIFSCLGTQLSRDRREAGEPGGIWCLPADSLLGPFDVAQAVRLTDESVYSGRLIRDRSGQWVMLAFRNDEPGRGFVGELIDSIPVGWAQDGTTLVEQFPAGPRRERGRPPSPFLY
jgi:beta-fructofuranosidase